MKCLVLKLIAMVCSKLGKTMKMLLFLKIYSKWVLVAFKPWPSGMQSCLPAITIVKNYTKYNIEWGLDAFSYKDCIYTASFRTVRVI
jgi:hypothetical protein